MRSPNPIRSLRQNIEWRTEPASRTAYLEDEPHIQAIDQLLPQIAAESNQAARPARQPFLYFRRKLLGRRCSCFAASTSPDASCQICYGSGFVGGWDLHGTHASVIDVTHPSLTLVNVKAAFDEEIRPTPFMLVDGAKKGFVETEISLYANMGIPHLISQVVGDRRRGTNVQCFIRLPGEITWVELTEENLKVRLHNSRLQIRCELSRNHSGLPSPRLSHLTIRYQAIPDVRMYGDMNLAEESFELGDMGFSDAFSTLSLYVPPEFDYFRNEDFLIRVSDQKRFKVTRIERNCVGETLLSHRVQARLLVPGRDALVHFP